MTNPNYTHLTMVVDRSGSMSYNGLALESTNSINNLIAEQRKGVGIMTVTLYQFDTEYEKVFGPTNIDNAPAYALQPRGGTALNDALYRAVTETGEYLNGMAEHERPGKVLFVVVTDGQENSSHEVTLQQVKDSIKTQTDTFNWEFVFLASGIDAFTTGNNYGFTSSVAMSASAKSYGDAYNTVGSALLASRSTGTTLASNLTTDDVRDEDDQDTPVSNTAQI